jgi:hypothetical protein
MVAVFVTPVLTLVSFDVGVAKVAVQAYLILNPVAGEKAADCQNFKLVIVVNVEVQCPLNHNSFEFPPLPASEAVITLLE